MIVRPAPAWPPDEAARRAARGADPVWLSSPGPDADVGIAFDVVSAAPVEVVREGSPEALEAAWAAARRRWEQAGEAAGTTQAPPGQAAAEDAVPHPPPRQTPIAIGWLSYELGRRWLFGPPSPARAVTSVWPALEFRFFDAIWVREVGAPVARILACDAAAAERLAALLGGAAPVAPPPPPPALGPLAPADAPPGWYPAAVARIQEYLRAGDAYQVNLARRLEATIGPGDPVWISAMLRRLAPAPHALWMGGRSAGAPADAPIDRYLVGGSPERFLRLEPDGTVETRPIKGTRPRARGASAGEAADAAARAALRASAKDRAEHVMIVDLERNDLGRVALPGSVKVEDLLRVIDLPTVFHLVTTVRARLRPGVGLAALLRATFPGGSITGAPKRRAMEIIDELEPAPRAVYTGATGWLGAAGDLDLAVAIRTALVAEGKLSLSVGGGIVIDSDPADELAETEAKARAFQLLWSSS